MHCDGKYKGKPLPDETYLFLIDLGVNSPNITGIVSIVY